MFLDNFGNQVGKMLNFVSASKNKKPVIDI